MEDHRDRGTVMTTGMTEATDLTGLARWDHLIDMTRTDATGHQGQKDTLTILDLWLLLSITSNLISVFVSTYSELHLDLIIQYHPTRH